MPAPARAFPLSAVIEHHGPAALADEYGDRPAEPVGTERVRCNLQPTASSDSSANEARETEVFNLYLPAGTVLGGQDVVIVDGERLAVTGPGVKFSDFGGRPHHVEATLRRVR